MMTWMVINVINIVINDNHDDTVDDLVQGTITHSLTGTHATADNQYGMVDFLSEYGFEVVEVFAGCGSLTATARKKGIMSRIVYQMRSK